MSRILKRPMFRMGGSTNEGIMHGLVDRKGYQEGSDNPYIKEAMKAFGAIEKPRDTSWEELLVGGGLNLVSGRGAGSGLMANIAESYREPSQRFFQSSRAAGDYNRKLQQAATQAGLEQKWTMEQLKAKENPQSALYNVYLQQGVERGMSGAEAQRFAAYHTDIQDKLRRKVGNNLIGGIIEDNFNTLNEKQRRSKISKMKKDIGKYFYDPYDGKIKQLVEQNGQLGFLEFASVDNIDFSAVPSGVSTESSTPYQDAQDFRDQEKSEGILTEEDIRDYKLV